MSALSPETRRLLALSRSGDDPIPLREQAVRNRLIARLGVTALAGVAGASAAVGAAEAAGAAGGAGALGTPGTAAGSAAHALSSGVATATWVKTVAAVVVVAGLGAGVPRKDDVVDHPVEWPATVALKVESVVKRAWHFVTGSDASHSTHGSPTIALPTNPELIHERLIAIARRPNHPVAKESELVLILAAERALAAGDHERAVRYLDQHKARFAGGELSDDREALRELCDRVRHQTNF